MVQVEKDKVPVTVLTGFLGSGKTTLLNRILTELHGKKLAVIENEFGEVGVDDALVSRRLSSEEEIFEMNNGCICCTVRGDLIRILTKLLSRESALKLDGIVIETTGLADPAPVAQTFFMDDTIKAKARLDGIITVVDAKHVVAHLDEEKAEGVENEAVEQIAFADKVILNKMDLVDETEAANVEKRIRSLNASAKIVRATKAVVDMEEIYNIHAFDLDRIMGMDPSFLSETEHNHDQSVTSVGITCEGNLDLEKMQDWVSKLLRSKGTDIYRSKGVLSIHGSPDKYVFQAVHMLFDGTFLEPWGPKEERANKMVFIGKNLDRAELNDSFRACLVK